MNSNWPRWIAASIHKHFLTEVTSLPIYIEGEPRSQNTVTDYAELRFDGPYAHEDSRNQWILDVEINVLIGSIPDEKDTHRIYKNEGIIAAAMKPIIKVYKYGDGINDDNLLLGCLHIKQSFNQTIFIARFGQVDPKINLLQSTIEAHYKMELNT